MSRTLWPLTRLGGVPAALLLAGALPICTRAQAASVPSPVPSLPSRPRPYPEASLDSLVVEAVVHHPAVHAAEARVDAARARLSASGVRPDPMIMTGIQNLPLGRDKESMQRVPGPDPMTMRMFGVQQTIPYPGKLGLEHAVARYELEAAEARRDAVVRQVTRDVQDAYAEMVFTDTALSVVTRHYNVLNGLVRTTDERYGAGTGAQRDALEARTEITRLAGTASALTEQRRAVLARLNALLGRPGDAPMNHAVMPSRVARAAVAPSASEVRFTSAALGARVADSPIPATAALQEMAARTNPELREQDAMIAAEARRLALARKNHLPDVDVSLQYGQRGGGLPDMVSATVSVPIPLSKRQRQDQEVAAAGAELAAMQADRAARVRQIDADVARLVAELEEGRAQLALAVKALLPQAETGLRSAVASYGAGKIELSGVLDAQSAVFTYETEYVRTLSDFAKHVAELEQLVGQEVLP